MSGTNVSHNAQNANRCSAVDVYPRGVIALHWLLAVALLVELALGWWMQELPKTPPGLRAGWFNLHKSIGITVALALPLRIWWGLTRAKLPQGALPAWQWHASQAAHWALYACMVVMPLSGYLGSTFTKYPVRYFGLTLPDWNRDWPAAKELMSSIHWASVWLFVLLLAAHVAAALWHWSRSDGVCARMGMPPFPHTNEGSPRAHQPG
jgi:cytochrome b561